MSESTTEFYVGQIFEGIYPPEAAEFCNESRIYYIDELENDEETGKRRFQIKEIPAPTEEEIAEANARRQAAIDEAARVPDLENATIELAEYIVALEERIAALEAEKEAE